MYYLRTMAASAPIQFTVDQMALQQVDTAVAKPIKKRLTRPVPAPMMEAKPARNGISHSSKDSDDLSVRELAVVDPILPKASPKKVNGIAKKTKEDMTEEERSIYDEAVLACSIQVSISQENAKCRTVRLVKCVALRRGQMEDETIVCFNILVWELNIIYTAPSNKYRVNFSLFFVLLAKCHGLLRLSVEQSYPKSCCCRNY